MTAEEYIQKLIGLSSKKIEGIRAILELTVKQSEVITEDSLEELTNIIDLKQRQMDMIDELDAAFEVYYSRLKSLLGVQSLEEIKMTELSGSAELKQMVTTIFNITKEIQQIERNNYNKANELLEHLARQVRHANQAKVANKGYNAASQYTQQSYFFDKKK